MRNSLSILLLLLLLTCGFVPAGCAGRQVTAPAEGAGPAGPRTATSTSEARRRSLAKGMLAPAQTRTRLDVYHLALPYGTVGRNEEFWKRVNEHCVDVATYDVLFKNGVRVGEAPVAEWDYFKSLIDAHRAKFRASRLLGPEGENVDLEVTKQVETQDIFYLDGSNVLHGRTYEKCENYLALSFAPTPRKPGHVRVAICPVVKTLRKRLEYSVKGNEYEFAYTHPERLYDLNLRADIPPGGFLIVAPSSEASWPSSVGASFLVHDGPAERMESVLLLVPVSVEVTE